MPRGNIPSLTVFRGGATPWVVSGGMNRQFQGVEVFVSKSGFVHRLFEIGNGCCCWLDVANDSFFVFEISRSGARRKKS